MSIIWIIIFIILTFIELTTINLVSIWFIIGSVASFITSLFTDNITIQLAVFIIVSFISLICTRKIVKKIKTKKITPTNLDRVIGLTGIVTEVINNDYPGEVKVDGKHWTATANELITKDSKVEILSIEGVKLSVKKIKEGE